MYNSIYWNLFKIGEEHFFLWPNWLKSCVSSLHRAALWGVMIRTEKTRSRLDFLNIAVGQRCSSLRAASLFPNMNDLWDFVMVNLKFFLDKAVWNIYVFSWPLQKLTDLGWEWKSITRCRMWRCEAESCCRKWKLFYTLKRGDRWYKNPYKHMQTKSIWKRQRKCKRKKK